VFATSAALSVLAGLASLLRGGRVPADLGPIEPAKEEEPAARKS
jgi:hypothetical protein